ncbi:zinc piracy TonB-dependent receptor ZnuD [Acinetobacter lwoffii]|uniref:TonB-dependent receptor n=1 Tax=Acinetobacter lwoffii TaxID=28090 RepID=A0A6N1MPT8_ACILW|nr:zinc piracy TonB-dependent receptor ZnuD [Acinetobacter lwoffii]MDP1371068.1 zinc piracy TonB-dependent receptor ZnuD [Acinetobacter lwoffii]MDP1390532.1 zinc piracy TonB-dependent receptor ZnuD [Acinetobacter lwoffii]MDP1448204.1 zinc piracy TonB-dependent receptor ZnuD [Acinetobacter lwoffii]NGP40336.1 TonB-dependent receptor [Acinetobacter lwoffii]QKU22614.1 TonB-dependent receptor [Acinetobacter lwoffii]
MSFPKNLITLSIFAVVAPTVFAEQSSSSIPVQTMDTIQVQAHPLVQTAADFAVADHVVDQKALSERATTIGDALADELGVYSNQYGSGSSRPVIRGQDGPRVKVLQHASETADVSTLSPDHAVTVDPILAKQVEVIRGPSTLLYGAGTVGGLVNVTDQKIPTQMPEDGLEGTVGLRYNSGSDEKLVSAGVTAGIGENFALRVEGSKRNANDYIAPDYFHEHDDELEKERRVGNTFAEGQTVNIGGSWIHDRGFVGLSYSNRQDQYGLPGHSHEYHGCVLHGDHFHGCPTPDPDAPAHEEHGGPWVDLKSERYEVRTELEQPFAGVEKLRVHASMTDYEHDELEENEVISNFKSKGYDGRLELVHVPVAGWEGVIGTQISQQKINLAASEHDHHEDGDEDDEEHHVHGSSVVMPDTKTDKFSLFALEHKQLGDVHVELGARVDHQKVKVDSDQKDYSGTGVSASAAANWEFAPNYKLSVVGSHQQRLPLAQELYADGLHFATNTYELGNPDLDKETSNNLELGLHYEGDKLDYHVHVYHNWFDDYIYGETVAQKGNLRGVQYTQDKARFYGTEAQAGYQINDMYKLSVFGDYVRGKIEGENAPRVPAGRLGTKVEADFADGWSGLAEYYHVFNQDKIASYEDETQGYNMVNVGLSYANSLADNNAYRVYFKANNLLDDQVYSHTSFLSNIPQVGRNFTVGVQYDF